MKWWPTLLLAVVAASAADAPRPCRLMPVGDSITEGGKTFSVYRYPLLKLLTDAGYRVEYVGSKVSDSPAGKLHHEGYGGRNAEYLATVVPEHFAQTPADIVLLHCGHNHFVDEHPVPGIVKATEQLIAACRKVNPRVTVLLAQVITSGKLPKYAYIPELNVALAELGKQLNTAEAPVVMVNQAEGWEPERDTITDKVHPNEQGAAKMAAKWFAALQTVLGPAR